MAPSLAKHHLKTESSGSGVDRAGVVYGHSPGVQGEQNKSEACDAGSGARPIFRP